MPPFAWQQKDIPLWNPLLRNAHEKTNELSEVFMFK